MCKSMSPVIITHIPWISFGMASPHLAHGILKCRQQTQRRYRVSRRSGSLEVGESQSWTIQ